MRLPFPVGRVPGGPVPASSPEADEGVVIDGSSEDTRSTARESPRFPGRDARVLAVTAEGGSLPGALRALRAPYLSEDRKNPRSGRKKTGLRQRAPRCAFERAPVLGMRHHHGARVLLGGVRPARLP